jgi:hypothetical protein
MTDVSTVRHTSTALFQFAVALDRAFFVLMQWAEGLLSGLNTCALRSLVARTILSGATLVCPASKLKFPAVIAPRLRARIEVFAVSRSIKSARSFSSISIRRHCIIRICAEARCSVRGA